MQPLCAVHPDRPAAGTCERCGAFACAGDLKVAGGRTLCASCAARPDASYLEAFRRKYWGRRDLWAWLMGVGALAHVLGLGITAVSGQYRLMPVQLAMAAAQVCYFLGLPWARGFIFAPVAEVVLVPLLNLLGSPGPLGLATVSSLVAQIVPGLVLVLALGLGVLLSTRNRLFFRLPVTPAQLQKAWDLYCNNSIARAGFLLSFLGLLVPGVGLVALVLCVIGLSRVNPTAAPPIGRRGQAIAGIAIGFLGTAGYLAYFSLVSLLDL